MPLATLKEVLGIATQSKTAIPGFNIDNIEIPEAIITAAEEYHCPVILTIGQGAIQAGQMHHLADVVRRLADERDAVLLAHNYQVPEIQDVADHTGDSLALSRIAADSSASTIVFCGVHFMAETNKILCPDKTVLIPDLNAQCSLAESCPPDKFAKFVEEHPGYTVLSYVNTSAAIKALTDVVVTSGNAVQVVESFPKDEKLIFGPDRNLGSYINSVTGRNMLLWDGACHVHSRFSPAKLAQMKKEHPAAKVLAHPECGAEILKLADYTGSTAAMLKFAATSNAEEFLVVTESGILHEMRKSCPGKKFIPVPPEDGACPCNECEYMRLVTMEKLYNCLKYQWPAVDVNPPVAEKAVRPIKRMLDISNRAKQ